MCQICYLDENMGLIYRLKKIVNYLGNNYNITEAKGDHWSSAQ